MIWFLLVVFGLMMVAVPSMVFYGRHVLPLRGWFVALWQFALRAVNSPAARSASRGWC